MVIKYKASNLIEDFNLNAKNTLTELSEMFGTEIEVDLNSVWKKEQMIQLTEAPNITDETSENPEEEKEEWKEEDVLNIDEAENEDVIDSSNNDTTKNC